MKGGGKEEEESKNRLESLSQALSPMAETTNKQPSDEEEEDYMGDLSQFLPPETTAPSKSSVKVSANNTQISQPSDKKRKTLNWQEQRKLKRENRQEEEDRNTLASLESAIPQSNIGFKLLKQMGYTPGSTLGKEGSGLAEPVGLEIRRTRAGIGREDLRKEKRKREEERMEWERGKEEALMEDFGCRHKEQWRSRRIVVNYHKAKAALEQLENKEVVAEADKDEEDAENEEEEEEIITEEVRPYLFLTCIHDCVLFVCPLANFAAPIHVVKINMF
ncbi:hypothetical protein ACSBR1_025705 [Camellia fascicularis]